MFIPDVAISSRNRFYGPEYLGIWRKERRICSEDVFDVYFLLGTPQGDVSLEELKWVIESSDDPNKLLTFFREMADERRLARLLDLLGDRVDDLTEAGVRGFCEALLVLGDELPDT